MRLTLRPALLLLRLVPRLRFHPGAAQTPRGTPRMACVSPGLRPGWCKLPQGSWDLHLCSPLLSGSSRPPTQCRPGSCLQAGSGGPSLRKHSSAPLSLPRQRPESQPRLSALSPRPTLRGAHLPARCPPSLPRVPLGERGLQSSDRSELLPGLHGCFPQR